MVASGRARGARRRMRSRPALAVLAVLVVTVLATAGCVSMPTGGPVQSFPVTQGPDAQSNAYVQIQPLGPRPGWSPQKIVQGFLTASASFGTDGQVALQYLTPHEQKVWSHPTWSAVVYRKGPDVGNPVYPGAAKTATPAATAKSSKTATPATTPTPATSPTSPTSPTTAIVPITGTIQATLKSYGSYSAPSPTATGGSSDAPAPFQLVKGADGQWRISFAPLEFLLTSVSFANDYQLRNLYFFDPTVSYLVSDPIYVPVRAPGDLLNGLVQDLISQPKDWLSGGATKTAFPAGTKIIDVSVAGVTAVVNLTGPITKASNDVLEQVSSQLLLTLKSAGQGGPAGQGVQSVDVELNGKQWNPPNSPDNPVQQQSAQSPATGANLVNYYYIDSGGYLASRRATGNSARLAYIGTGFTQVAVSPDGKYLAALHGSSMLYTGLITGGLTKQGSGYEAISWDSNDDLWASLGGQVVMFRATVSIRPQSSGRLTRVPVQVWDNGSKMSVPFTALKVAPDGVRVALVIDSGELVFGAISGQQGPDPQIQLSLVQFIPPGDTVFTGLTWYGADNVITLATPGPTATEYPVSGGTPIPIQAEPGMDLITATSGNLLVAGLLDGTLAADTSPFGAWMPLGVGGAPAYPG